MCVAMYMYCSSMSSNIFWIGDFVNISKWKLNGEDNYKGNVIYLFNNGLTYMRNTMIEIHLTVHLKFKYLKKEKQDKTRLKSKVHKFIWHNSSTKHFKFTTCLMFIPSCLPYITQEIECVWFIIPFILTNALTRHSIWGNNLSSWQTNCHILQNELISISNSISHYNTRVAYNRKMWS